MAKLPRTQGGLRVLALAALFALAVLPSMIPGLGSPEPVRAASGGCSPSSPTCFLFDVSLSGTGFGTYTTLDAEGNFSGRIVCRYGNETQTGTCGWGYEPQSPGAQVDVEYRVTPDQGSQVCEGTTTVTCYGASTFVDVLGITGNYAENRWRFELINHVQIDVLVAGGGSGKVTSNPAGINCPDDCDDLFAANLPVTLTAKPNTGSVFGRWEGACTGTKPTCVVTTDFLQTVTARFNKKATPPPPTKEPTKEPTEEPTDEPTEAPSPEPAPETTATAEPRATNAPTPAPSTTGAPTAPSPTRAPSPTGAEGGGNLPIIIGLAIVLVLLAGGAVFFARRGRPTAV